MRGSSWIAAAFLLTVACAAADGEHADTTQQGASTFRGARVCSWNIRRLGHLFDHREKDLVGTAKAIDDQCDVVAVQEVMQTTGGGSAGFEALRAKLGAAWDGMVASRPRPDTTSSNSEYYGFYYRREVAKPCSGWTAVRYLPDEQDAFLREPAWTCLSVKGFARELLIASYHAMFGSGPADPKREVSWLDNDLDLDGTKDDVVRTMRASRPGNAAVLIMGDLNLPSRDLAEALPTFKDLTVGSGSTINGNDQVTDNLYDHVLAPPDEPLGAMLAPAEVVDIRRYATQGSYFGSISDHLPIRFVLPVTATPDAHGDPPPVVADGPYGPGSALPLANGDSPSPEFGIKGNEQSKIYHTPESPYFDLTKAEVWFRTTADAERAGFRSWLR
jgi:endonuclease/exonuclease/phosphatase family metal-dependent hydrolase